MKKIAIVNQRYGLEVNGGSEYYTRLIAEHLKDIYNIEILTTTALNYDTWENHYREGVESVNDINVRRFVVDKKRNMFLFRVASKVTRVLGQYGIHLDKWWVREQGPVSLSLVRYIREHREDYDVFIFVTYLYYPTVMGLPEVADKSILIPTAHDEPYINFPIYKYIFKSAKGMIFLTEEEREFVQKCFHNTDIPNDVIGIGIDIPEELEDLNFREKAIEKFRKKYNIDEEYIIYAGRVDVGKNCHEMFEYFQKYKEKNPNCDVQLVIIGKDMLGIPEQPYIHYLGYVSEEDKYVGIAGAKLLWLPSEFESLSIALLEAMALGVPGIVNGKCAVLKGHCRKSKGAVYYESEKECMRQLVLICNMSKKESDILSSNAHEYIEKYYCWDKVKKQISVFLNRI